MNIGDPKRADGPVLWLGNLVQERAKNAKKKLRRKTPAHSPVVVHDFNGSDEHLASLDDQAVKVAEHWASYAMGRQARKQGTAPKRPRVTHRTKLQAIIETQQRKRKTGGALIAGVQQEAERLGIPCSRSTILRAIEAMRQATKKVPRS